MADYTLPELLGSVGTTTGDFLKDLANNVADGYCSMYKSYPGFTVGYASDPLTPFRRGLADSLCRGRAPGLPSLAPPFTGGQCNCIAYDVWVSQFVNGSVTNRNIVNCWGPIYGLVFATVGSSIVSQIDCKGNRNSGGCGSRQLVNVTSYSAGSDVRIEKIVRVDGQADSCGDPPADYPVASPPSSVTNLTVTVPVASGSPPVTVPVIFAPVTGVVEVNVPVTANLNLTFSLGGVTFKAGGSDGFTSTDRATLVQTSVSSSSAAANSQTAATAATGAKNSADAAAIAANDAKNNSAAAKTSADAAASSAASAAKNTAPPKPPSDASLTKTQRPSSEKKRDSVPGLVWVQISLTKLPYSNKSQFGDGAKDVYYCGWFEWSVEGAPLPRIPINFSPSLFLAPKGATGYGYTLTNGASGFATEFTE